MLRRAILLTATLGVTSACAAISTQEEVQLGANYAAQIDTALPIVRDAEINRYITTLGNALAAVSDTRNLAWRFTVVDSKEVNAFAVPGGYIYVNRGLIERAATVSEVAGVLGHEIGHVTLRHSVQQMQSQQGANVGISLLCTLTKSCESALGQTAIGLGANALFAKFSRSDETEADQAGVITSVKGGMDPNGIPEMFRTLLNERQSNPSAVDGFFSSHPLEESRIAATTAQIAQYPASSLRNLTKDTPAFQSFKRRLMALPPSPAPKKA